MTSTLSLEVGVLLLAASFSVVRGKASLHDHNNIRLDLNNDKHNLLHLLQMDYMLRKMLGWKLDTVYKSIKCQTF